MREGVLLCEKDPRLLMEEHNAHYLEDAFLKLCQHQNCEVNKKKSFINFIFKSIPREINYLG